MLLQAPLLSHWCVSEREFECVTSTPQQSLGLQGRMSLYNPSGKIWFVWLELFDSYSECAYKRVCQSSFKSMSLPPLNSNNTSKSPHGVWQIPLGVKRHSTTHTNNNLLLKDLVKTPCGSSLPLHPNCGSSLANFFLTSSSAQSARTRHERRRN